MDALKTSRKTIKSVQVQPGFKYAVPSVLTGQSPPKAVLVTQRGKDLLIRFPDGQIELLEDFFTMCQGGVCAAEVTVEGQEPVVITPETPASAQTLPDNEFLLFAGGNDQAFVPLIAQDAVVQAVLYPNGWEVAWGQLMPSTGLASLFSLASGGGGGSALATVGASAMITQAVLASDAVVDHIVRGVIVAGPVIQDNQFIVRIYGDRGQLLGQITQLSAGGAYEFHLGAYSGVVKVFVTDSGDGSSNDGTDYVDEVSRSPKDLNGVLAAVGVVSEQITVLNINPLTTLAALRAGVNLSNPAASVPTIQMVDTANTEVAQAMGVGSRAADLLSTEVVPVVTQQGQTNPLANNYGKILAAIAGAEVNTNKSTTEVVQQVLAGFTPSGTALSDSAKLMLVQGGELAQVSDVPLILNYSSQQVLDNSLSDGQISASELSALTTAQLGQLTGVQVAMLTTQALSGLTAVQVAAIAANGGFSQLNAAQIISLPIYAIYSVPTSVIATLTADQVAALSGEQLAAITSDQAAAIAAAGGFNSLSPSDIAALSPAAIDSVPPSVIGTLTADQVAALSDAQLAAITSDQAAAIAAAGGFNTLSPSDIAALSPAATDSVPPGVIGTLTPTQVAALSDAQIQALTPEQLNALVAPGAWTGTDQVGADTWSSGVVNDATPLLQGSISGVMPALASLVVYDGNTRLGAAVVQGHQWTFTPTTALSDGTHSLSVRIEVQGGSSATASAPVAIDVDTALSIIQLSPGTAGNTYSLQEQQAGESAIRLQVEAQANWTLTLIGSSSTQTITGTGSGAVQDIALTASQIAALGQGAVQVHLAATDPAGNTQTLGSGADFTIQSAPPNAPLLTLLGAGAAGVSASEAGSGIFTVTAQAGTTVQLTLSHGTQHIVKTLQADGTAQAVPLDASDLLTLGDGTITVTGTASDAQGNASASANSLSWVLDTQAPVISSGNAAFVPVAANAGSLVYTPAASDVGTQGIRYSLTGPDAQLFDMLDSSTGVVTWRSAAPATPSSSDLSINVIATDAAGNASTQAVTVRVVDRPWVTISSAGQGRLLNAQSGLMTYTFTFANGDPSFSGVSGFDVSDIQVTGGQIVTGSFSGSGAVYTVQIQANANSSGTLSINLPAGAATGLFNGQSQVTAAAVTYTQGYDTAVPAAPLLSLASDVTAGADGASQAEAIAGAVTVQAEAGTQVSVTLAGTHASVTKILQATGSAQSIVLTSADLTTLGDGTVTVSASTQDTAGNTSESATPVGFKLDTVAPVFNNNNTVYIASNNTAGTLVMDWNASDGAGADAGLSYSLSGADAGQFVLDPASGQLTLRAATAAGIYRVQATATDTSGNSASHLLDVVVTDTPTVTVTSNPASGTVRSGQTAVYTFTFSQAVWGFRPAMLP